MHEQDRSQNVDSIRFGEELRRNFLQRRVFGYCGIIDDDVDMEFSSSGVGEVVLGGVDQVGGASRVGHVGLDGEGIDIVGRFEGICYIFRGLGRGIGGVI